MKHTLLIALFSFIISSFIIASTDTFTDKMAAIGSPGLSSDPCAAIDKKLIKLDTFTRMLNNTSSFYLEEKASAIPVPGITVSNNKKKMLRDAKKKYMEYAAERQKYACDTSLSESTDEMDVNTPTVKGDEVAMNTDDKYTDQKDIVSSSGLSSDQCAALDKKLIKLDAFTRMVNNTSSFYLEEKASAIPVPGITVSNNKKKMLKDARKKYMEYSSEREKYACDTPLPVIMDEKEVVVTPVLVSEQSVAQDKKPVKQDNDTTKVKVKSTPVTKEAEPKVVKVQKITTSKHEEPMIKAEETKAEAVKVKETKYVAETPAIVTSAKMDDEKTVVPEPVLSTSLSDSCADIDKKLTELYEFMMMVNNTSAFHLEEKAEALSVPGISISNNKKRMLRDAKKKYDKLLSERQRHGCDRLEN